MEEKINPLQEMIGRQINLIAIYQRIEGLPSYPLELGENTNRKWVKEFGERCIEELAEAWEELVAVYQCAQTNNNEGKMHLQNFNRELGDAWHFFLELLIFCGYLDKEIEYAVLQASGETDPELSDDPLSTMWRAAKQRMEFDGFDIAGSLSKGFKTPAPTIMEQGGGSISMDILENAGNMMWIITFHFKMACNKLKHKPWSQGERTANLVGFHEELGMFMFAFMGLMVVLGKSPQSIFATYMDTNKKNNDRIKNGY